MSQILNQFAIFVPQSEQQAISILQSEQFAISVPQSEQFAIPVSQSLFALWDTFRLSWIMIEKRNMSVHLNGIYGPEGRQSYFSIAESEKVTAALNIDVSL